MNIDELIVRPIGVIHTPFTDRYKAPRQPGAESAMAEGRIVLFPKQNFEQALEDLSGFEKIWIVSWFHRNENWKPKVLPPRGPRKRRGVFATRSPHRPNPIGLSLATLLEIKGRVLRVAETDLLDGTPILDLKPYLPYAEAFPDAKAGWLDEVIAAEKNSAASVYAVKCSALARKQMDWLREEFGVELEAHATRVLSRDAAPHPYRRITADAKGALQLAIKSWRILFSVAEKCVTIERVASGYTRAALPSAQHDAAAHAAFHQKWADKS
jgi:tRNA-Thr(GGU) m(6)t(6)A37 methyltransferase TsaA